MADEERGSGESVGGERAPRARRPSWMTPGGAAPGREAPVRDEGDRAKGETAGGEVLLGPPRVGEGELSPLEEAPDPDSTAPAGQAFEPPSAVFRVEHPEVRARQPLGGRAGAAASAAGAVGGAPAGLPASVELDELAGIVGSVESLTYLKPRLARLRQAPPSEADLVGLYRIVSRTLVESLGIQAQRTRETIGGYERRLRQVQEEVLFQAGEQLVRAARGEAARPSEAAHSEPPSEGEDPGMVGALRKQVEIKDQLLLEAQERYDKMVHDVRNIRGRAQADLELQMHRLKEGFFRKLLPVLDSFDQARDAARTARDLEGLIQGLEQIQGQLLDACQSEGLEALEVAGQPFDPHFHEAMGMVETSAVPEEHIYDELRRGYLLGGRLLRASMVRMAVYPSGPTRPPAPVSEDPGA